MSATPQEIREAWEKEEREAWDRYVASYKLTGRENGLVSEYAADYADDLLKERRKRFKQSR